MRSLQVLKIRGGKVFSLCCIISTSGDSAIWTWRSYELEKVENARGFVQGMERNCEGVQERLDVTTAYHATPPGAVSKGEKR